MVPTQLLEMTVTVMHNRFGGLIRKNIWTFRFVGPDDLQIDGQ